MRQRWWNFFPAIRGLVLCAVVVTMLASVLLIQVFSTPALATEAEVAKANKVMCAALGWEEAENIPGDSFQCGTVEPGGSFRLLERYKTVLGEIFRKRVRQREQWKSNNRSIFLFSVLARWETARWGRTGVSFKTNPPVLTPHSVDRV